MDPEKPLQKPPGYKIPTMQSPQPRRTPPPPSYYRPNKRRRHYCRSCCCWCLCFFLVLIVLFAVAGGIFYLWFQPKSPVFRFRPIEIKRFNVTKQPGSDFTRLDSEVVIRVEVRNPNSKLKIYYGLTQVSLTADQDTELGSAAVDPFRQPTSNVTMMKFTATVKNRSVDDTVAAALAVRVESKEVVITANVKTKVGVGIGKSKFGMLPVNVNCGGLSLKQLNDGLSSPKCSFTTLRWITIH